MRARYVTKFLLQNYIVFARYVDDGQFNQIQQFLLYYG